MIGKQQCSNCFALTSVIYLTRIIVLDAGKIKEFASPRELLADKDSIFASLVRHANLKLTT